MSNYKLDVERRRMAAKEESLGGGPDVWVNGSSCDARVSLKEGQVRGRTPGA